MSLLSWRTFHSESAPYTGGARARRHLRMARSKWRPVVGTAWRTPEMDCHASNVPPGRFELPPLPPEGSALSPELWGPGKTLGYQHLGVPCSASSSTDAVELASQAIRTRPEVSKTADSGRFGRGWAGSNGFRRAVRRGCYCRFEIAAETSAAASPGSKNSGEPTVIQ